VENKDAGKPIHASGDSSDFADNWLLIAEVPHLKSHDARYPPVHLASVLGYARIHEVHSAVVLHDLLPLTAASVVHADQREKVTFIAYAQSLANADAVFPVSWTSAHELLGWLRNSGYSSEHLPWIKPIPIAHEVPGVSRQRPSRFRWGDFPNHVKYFSLGTVCQRKNQLKAFEAFNRIRLRHPKINMEFHVVGTVDPELAGSVARQVARSNGSIRLYGFLPDDKIVQLINESRATVFVSVAEGFGLPIAESLWFGKPCLCSNFGAMAETATGGGCLTVDPTSVAAIEDGLFQLATDQDQYAELLNQIRARELRTWQEYASDVRENLNENGGKTRTEITEISSRWVDYQPTKQMVSELLARMESSDAGNWREFVSDIRKQLNDDDGEVQADIAGSFSDWMGDWQTKKLAAGQKSFHIDLKSLKYHDDYVRRGKVPIFDQHIIRYRREDFNRLFKKIREPHLFYGPYIELEAGRYMFSIDGEVTGSVTIKLMKTGGIIRQFKVVKLNETIVLDLPGPIKNFEIVAEKTDQTEALEIRSILVEFTPLDSLS
jgi:glycosyltransferase involved in cell wall biosynthesis